MLLLDARSESATVLARARLFEGDVETYAHPALAGTRLYARGAVACAERVRVALAPSYGEPLVLFDPGSRGAKAYAELTNELLQRESKQSSVTSEQ